MAIREFADEQGRRWRAWDIRPEAIHPVTKAEDYLADCFVTGWIVFEAFDGEEKRRLCPWPKRWMEVSDQGLCQLLRQAEVVPRERMRTSGEYNFTDLPVVRTFRYPGGGSWMVNVVAHPDSGGDAVLRFSSGGRFIDLRQWPKDWADQTEEELAAMLRRGAPRRISGPQPGMPARRWDDPSDATA
jgi:hypothetical protein